LINSSYGPCGHCREKYSSPSIEVNPSRVIAELNDSITYEGD